MARPKEKQEEEKKETGKKYLPVQSSAGTKGQTAQERAKEILSMSREEQKARNQARLREALNRSAQSRPASSAQTEAMRRNFTKREQKEEYRRRYGTPQSSREAREQYQWNKRQREALEQYQSYFEKYGQKPTEEQVQNNPVLSDIGQLWKTNAAQVQDTQKALEEIESTRVPSRAGRALFMAAQNANSIAPMEQARARELPQLSQEDQAFVDNARKRLEELYPQRDALEAKGDAEGLAEVNRLIDNEEKVMRDRGVALPGEVAETVDKYALGGSKDLEAYLEAKRNVELMDEEIALGGVIAPEENKAYQDLKARVERGEELTGQDVYDYKVWSEQYGAYERDKETIKTLEEAGVLESGYSYAAQERQRVNEGQLTQIEALTQYAGTIQAPIAKQEASKLLTELYNQQYALEKDIAAMQQAGAGNSIGDNLALKATPLQNAQEELEAVKAAIAEAEYAMLRFEDDFFMNVQPGAGAGKKGSVYHVVNATEEELAKLRARGVGQSVMPVRSGVADAIAGLSGQELNALRMTDMERQTYNYLHNTQGAEAADAYFKSLEPRLLKRQAEMQQGVWQTMAEHPVGAFTTTAATFPMTLVEGLGAVKTGVDTMLGRETSPYDSAFAPTRFKSTVRETVKAGQREAFGEGLGGDIANLAYDVVTTSLDSALSMAAGGATGGSAIMALSATSGKTQQELLLGRDNSQALVQGLAAGVIEAITEKMGMDRLTAAFSLGKKGGYRTILANMIKGFVPEALEELPGNVVDRALDNYLNGDSSQRAESIKQKRAAGMSVTQATVETDMEFVVETLQGMLVGGLSGSLGAGVSTSVGMIKARSARTALTEAGVDADTAQAAAERISGLRSDTASEQAVRAAVEQMQQAEDAKGVKHTPFAAEATAAGYEDVPVKVTGFQGIRDGAAWVEIEIAGKGKGEIRLDQVRFADTDTQAAYNRAAMFEDTQTARRFLAGYENTSLPLEIYGQAFQSAYQAGQNSRAMTEYERKVGFGTMLEDGVYRIAYQAGQEATAAQNARLEIPESLGKTVQEQLGKLPRTYTQGYTGVVYAAKTTRPTKAQAVMLSLLDDYAKAHGVHYTVVDSIGDGGANGVYTTSEGMVVALDAEEGYLTRVATHEGWHYIREHMGQEAQGLQDAVLELLGNTEGYNLDSRVAEKQEQYKQIKGQELSREEALEELTADALYDAMATPEALGAFVSRAYENAENKNAFQQAMDQVMAFINRFVAEVKALAKKIAGKNPEARAMLEHEADWGESIIQEYNRLMEEAGKRERSTKQNKKGYGQDSQFSLKVLPDGRKYVEVDTDQQIFEGVDIKDYPKLIVRYITQRFRGKVIGTQNRAYVDKRAANEFAHPANHSLNEKIYEAKARTATELDNLMDAGRYIGHFEDNGRHADALGGWDRYEAIVKVNDAFYEGQINIMILGDGRRRFHDFTKIRDVSAALQDRNALRRDNVSDNSISKTAENSNTNKNFSLKNVDTDMTETQREEKKTESASSSSVENNDAQTETPYAYRVLTEKGDRTVVDVSDVGEITRDEAVQRGLENVRKYTDKTDRNGVPMMYVDDLGKYVTVGSKALRHGLDRRAQANSAVTAHIGDLLKQAIVINEANPKKENHTNTYILLSVARDSNQENVYVRMVVNQSTGQLEDVTSLYALNTKKGARRVVAPNGEVSPGVPAGSTMTIAEILENVKDIYSDVLSKDVLKALGVEKRSESELTQRLRYSLRNVDTDMTEMQRVVEENERLQKLVGSLNAQLRAMRDGANGKAAVDRKAVWALAREMKAQYQSKVRVNDLGANLQKAFDAMANARTDTEGKSAMEAMAAIARDMLDKSENIDSTMYDEYADLRGYLRKGRFRLTDAQWAEAAKLYGSEKEFRKAAFGRWNIAARNDRNALSLDAAWEEMHQQWPGMFDQDASEGDKVQQVMAALEAVRREVSNPYAMNLEEMTQYVTAEMYQKYLEAPTVKGAEARTQETARELEKTRAELREARRELEQSRAEIAAARQEAQEDRRMTAEMINVANENAQQIIKKWSAKREEMAERRKARAEVIRQKGRILKKLNSPKSGSFVPYQMRDAVTALLEALDYNEGKGVTIKREMLERARQEYEAVLPKRDANGSAVPDTGIPALAAFYNGDVSEAMQRLAQSADGKQLNRLSHAETIELRDILRSYAAMIINEDRLFMQKRRDSLQEAGDGLVARMLQRKAHKQRGKAAETVLNVTNRALLSPGTVFHIFEGTEMEPIWKALRDAENTHTRHVAQGQAYMEAALKEYGVQEIINQSERKQLENGVEVTLHDGKKQKFRIQEAMYIYAAAKREKLVGTNHLLGGGIVFQKNSHPGEATGARQLTAEDLEAIAGKLTEKQKAFVDHMVQFLSRDTAEWGNQVTRELYGVEKFKESYYVPFKVARNYLRTDPASQQENRLKLGSFTKPLAQQASNPLEVQNFVEMWAAHMEQMSDYNAFVLPIEDMTRLMNYKTDNDTVRSVMQERYGNQVPDYILSFLRRLNGNAKSEMGSALVNKLVGGAKGAAVGGNLSVASQQATAVLRAYALIDAKYLVKGMGAGALSAAKMKKSYAEIMDWAPIATQKSWGYFDTNMTRGTYDRARQTAMGKLDDALGYLSQKGDELAFTMIWEAVKREVAAESGLTRGTEAYFRRCGERFTEVIDQTQVVDSIFQRTELATEKGLARLWTSFMSEPFKQYNMLWRAGWDLKEAWRSGNKAAIKQARNQMIRTSASVVLSSVAAAAAKSLISAMRDDDDEKKEKDENGKTVTVGVRGFGEKYWDAFLPNLLDNATGLLPLVGNWLGSFITGETYNSSSMDSALLDSITRMWQALGKGDYEMAWYRGLQVVSNATGLGLGNAYRDGKALFTTLVKTLQRDTLAGTAWDKSKPFATRLQAATKNYVYAKQEGDSRRASPAVFYDLLLDAWYAGGTGEEFQQVATAMLETGATVDGIASGFKSRLRGSEELVTKAADAYEQGKYSEYEKHVLALVRLGIGQKAAVSMVDSVLDSRKKATEEPEAQTWEMLLDELTDDDADLFSTKDLLEAIQRGDQAEADYLLGRLKESKEESTIRSGLTEAYRKEYVAAWEKGDTAAMKKISDLLLGLDVGYTEESIAKWPRDEMNADYREAIESGDAGQVRTVIAAMKKEGYTDSDLRSKLTQDYKASYTQAWNAGNKTQAQSIAAMLKGLAVGYTEDSFKEWRVDSLKADWDAAVEARDVTRLKTQISRQMAAGMNQKQIRDKVWNAYGEAYVMALAEGNTSTARQLAGLMLNTGAGLTAEEVPQKAVNKAHSIYENSVESGDLNTARQVLKYLNQAEDGDRLWDKLYNWAKDAFMDAYDSGEYADLEKNLVSMGFSQKTINGWKD